MPDSAGSWTVAGVLMVTVGAFAAFAKPGKARLRTILEEVRPAAAAGV